MKMLLVTVDIDSLRENINQVESNTGGKAYLFMNNQTMRCLENISAHDFESFLEFSNGEEINRYQYKGNKIIVDNDIEFGKVEIR